MHIAMIGNRPGVFALALVLALAGVGSAMAAMPARVTSGEDSGPGSLRAALASGATQIEISASVTEIVIASPLVYAGTEPLRIVGRGQTIRPDDGDEDFTLLEASNGANLNIRDLTFDGGGGFNLDNPGNGKGVFIAVPDDRTGVVRLELTNVRVRGVANHGIHVSDCTLGDDCGGGSGGGGDGSPASVHVILDRVMVEDAGNGKFDADGVRIDERNDGGIMLDSFDSLFTGVGADGVELDEGNNGDVHMDVRRNHFLANGGFCLDAPLEIEQPCVEEDDGELELDLDDGFDIDEAGAGALLGSVSISRVNDNLDEGLDFDEEGPGGVNLQVRRTDAMGNSDEGVKVSSANSGDVLVSLNSLYVVDNDNDGIQIEAEDGDGEVHVLFFNSVSMGNDDDGLNLSQEQTEPAGTLRLRGFADVDSLDLENVVER